MSRRLTRIWLLPMLLYTGQAWALGLGEIRLSSALNEPLRAEIELLAATPEELNNLTVQLASAETFARYGLDRPLFLTRLRFEIVKSASVQGNVVRVRSDGPITEPFVTVLIEANWSRGRLLREYTVLLDPPTFVPPPVSQAPAAVTAPQRPAQSDAGRIERPAPDSEPGSRQPSPAAPPPVQATEAPRTTPPSTAEPAAPAEFDNAPGDTVQVARGDTLWRIAEDVRPDNRLTMNQTMLAIYQANPDAFAGNINLLNAGATLRIPSADEIYRISRSEALSEVQRQHEAWGGAAVTPSRSEPSLVLVPPDDDQDEVGDPTTTSGVAYSREAEIEDRIAELEADVPDQESLLEIRNNELAQLRQELARIRGEEYIDPAVVEEVPVAEQPDGEAAALDDAVAVDDEEIFVDDEPDGIDATDAATDDAMTDDVAEDTAPPVVSRPASQPSLVDTILGYVFSLWGAIAAIVIVVLAVLVWLARRAAREDDDGSGVWNTLDGDDIEGDSLRSTERLSALARDDDTSIVVVEQESKAAMAKEMAANRAEASEDDEDVLAATGSTPSFEDTFSSETAINLDQSDPIAEADFHMAYGLHDQAADLINSALDAEPEREDLLAKLCEVYFVWGNRDAFIDAAQRMHGVVGNASSADWDKIVIMGQQIAADHALFSGKSAAEATRAVDLSFDGAMESTGVLDMDFASGPDGEVSEVIDLGAESGERQTVGDASSIDFSFDEPDSSASATREMPGRDPLDHDLDAPTIESAWDDETAEQPADVDTDSTAETPTIEQQFENLDVTGEVAALGDNEATELASLDDLDDDTSSGMAADATAEIDLDDLGLDLDGLDDTGLADDDAIDLQDREETGTNESLLDDDSLAATGKNPATDEAMLAETSRNEALDEDSDLGSTGMMAQLDETDVSDTDATGTHTGLNLEDALAATSEMKTVDADDDITGVNRALPDDDDDDDLGIDTSLLDATGQTQILSDDFAVETSDDVEPVISDDDKTMLAPGYGDDDTVESLPDDVETLLAPLDDDDDDGGDFDFAKTEALPKDVFTGDTSSDETGELPQFSGSTDVDLDLDDLTAALKVSEVGDTVNQRRDDVTVEHPRLKSGKNLDLDVGDLDDQDEVPTQALTPQDVPEDLYDARTMTEVGTKLDLARAYVDMGDPGGARSILEEVLDEGDDAQRQQAQQLLDSLPS